MAKPETNFTETEALLYALERDSDEVREYLTENFMPKELRHLKKGAERLAEFCDDVEDEVQRRYDEGIRP